MNEQVTKFPGIRRTNGQSNLQY